MNSNTKNLLSREQIEKLTKVNFGDSYQIGNIKELKGGMFNSAYLLERVSQKDNIVLKVSIAPGTKTLTYEQDIMPTEVEVYRQVHDNTSIPAPQILAYDFSKKHIPGNYFFMTALKGQAMHKVKKKISKENLEEIKIELAGYFAQLHRIKGEYFGYFTDDSRYQFKSWKAAYLHMMEMLLQDGRQHGIRLPYDRYAKILKEKSSYLDQVKDPVLVDYDLWAGNIFLKKNKDRYEIEGIIDFERAFYGDPLADFSAAMLVIKNLHEETAFWEEYCKKSNTGQELTREEDIRLAFYSLYIFTIMQVETFRYNKTYALIQNKFASSMALNYLNYLEQA